MAIRSRPSRLKVAAPTLVVAFGLMLTLAQQGRSASPPANPAVKAPSGDAYGTSVTFLNNPVEAGRKAGQNQKLLFMLHISGNFEDRQFT